MKTLGHELISALAELDSRIPELGLYSSFEYQAPAGSCVQQALNSRGAPGVTDLILNPDAHSGYGAPVGCVMVSPTHIYPGPVGVDIKCSMSLLQMNVPEDAIQTRETRRALINAIGERIPTGAGRGQRSVKKSRAAGQDLGRRVVTEGAAADVCTALGIPPEWAEACEDAFHRAHDGTVAALESRLGVLFQRGFTKFDDKIRQLGSYGGGNHFGECEVVHVSDDARHRAVADTFTPEKVRPGVYQFAVGTAGSSTLVFQTVLPALLTATAESSLICQGGTHNPFAPPFDFLDRCFVPQIRKMGAALELELIRPGFFPAGGGEFRASIKPAGKLTPLSIREHGKLIGRHATIYLANLSPTISDREHECLKERFPWAETSFTSASFPNSPGPGNAVLLEEMHEHVTEISTGFGEKGVTAENVVRKVSGECCLIASIDRALTPPRSRSTCAAITAAISSGVANGSIWPVLGLISRCRIYIRIASSRLVIEGVGFIILPFGLFFWG